jgi:MFS family permease
MAQGGYRSALAHRDFRRLAVALVVNQAGSWAYSVVLLVYLFQRTHSTAWVSAGMLVRFVPGLLLSSFAGVIAERYERRRILLTSTFVDGVAMTGMVVAVALDAPPGIPVALAGLVAAVSTPVIPAVAALTPQLVGERDLVAANAVQATIDHARDR